MVRPQKGPTGGGRPSRSGPRKGCQEGKGGEGRRACSATRAETWGEGGEEEGEERGEGGGDGASEKVTLSMPSMRTGSRALESADRSSVHGRWRRERIPILSLLLLFTDSAGFGGIARARPPKSLCPPPANETRNLTQSVCPYPSRNWEKTVKTKKNTTVVGRNSNKKEWGKRGCNLFYTDFPAPSPE